FAMKGLPHHWQILFTSIFVILHILVKHELFTARIISLFVYSRKPLSTHVNKCVSVTSGKSP
ncbi:hypothetical protein, partial [Phocaeicola coprophilus]|uniref:hypothetical protein n=1 Tax=Phocaeicola coprophilus TaxID=387090 RepID=UPI003AB55400